MALFNRNQPKAIMATPEMGAKPVTAASGWVSDKSAVGNLGLNSVGAYYSYQDGVLRQSAMSVPTIARARDLIASVISTTPLRMYRNTWNEATGEMEKTYIAPRSWIAQPDPAVPYSTFMSWLFDDLFFFGKAFLVVTERTKDGFPSAMTRIPAAMTTMRDQAGPVFFAPSEEVYFQGGHIDSKNLIQFVPCPIQGIVYQSEQAVQTALRLEKARFRNATSTMPSGVLKVTGGEPLTVEEMQTLSNQFNAARENNQVAAISQDLDYKETSANPANMMLMDAAEFQAKEMCRLTNIPFYLAGIDVGAYQYSSGKQAREDLYLFAARLYMNYIQEILSMNNVLPRGTYVEFDIDYYLQEITDYPDSIKENISLDHIPTDAEEDAANDETNMPAPAPTPTPTTGA